MTAAGQVGEPAGQPGQPGTPAGPAGKPGTPAGPAGTGTRPDPLKGLRGIMAATLVLEAIVVALAMLVVAKGAGGVSSAAGWTVGLLALAMLLAALVQRRSWGLGVAIALQLAMIACWPLVPTLGIVGVVFGLVWAYLLWLRHDLTRRLAAVRPPDGPGE